MAVAFKKASKSQSRLRLGLCGPSGAGKTYTALRLASTIGDKIAVIDTEHGSASKYADEFDFDVLELDSYHPQNYIDGIKAASDAGYDVVVVDSLTHAWAGKDGVLELHDQAVKRQRTKNSYTAWGDVTPLHQQLIEAMLSSKLHLIATMRSKVEYVQEKDSHGKTEIRKVGMAPVQRDGMEYEFDIVGDIDVEHNLVITKSRCKALADAVVNKPGEELGRQIKAWLTDGSPIVDAPPEPPQQQPQAASDDETPLPQTFDELMSYAHNLGLSDSDIKEALFVATGHETLKGVNLGKSDLRKWLNEIDERGAQLVDIGEQTKSGPDNMDDLDPRMVVAQ